MTLKTKEVRVYPSLQYKQVLLALNLCVYDTDEPITSDYNKQVSALRQRLHLALGEAEKAQKEGDHGQQD